MKKFIKSIILVCFSLVSFNGGSYDIHINVDHATLLSASGSRNIRNIAVFIEFSDSDDIVQNHLDDEESVANAYKVYNSEDLFEMKVNNGTALVPSFKRFYKDQSYGSLIIDTDIYPNVNNTVISFRDSHPYNYYLANSSSNSLGYSNYDERTRRENELIDNAIKSIKSQIENTYHDGSILDTDSNGYVDAISFIIEIPSMVDIGYGDLLWSHMATATNVSTKLFDKAISSYNLITATDYKDVAGLFSLNRGGYGTLMHEFGHTLGFHDLYNSFASRTASVGFYDLMGNYPSSNPPGFLTYFISDYQNYNNWHNPLDIISSTTRNITLTKPEYLDPSEKRAIKIQGGSRNEFFIVEYISKRNTYENYTVDKPGIIVYRINTNESDFSKMIYIFRPNEVNLGEGKGELKSATLHMDRKVLGKVTTDNRFDNETIHYSDGSNSGIVITVTGETDSSVTFDIEFPNVNGDGTENNPYLISSIDDFLYYMGSTYASSGHYFKIINDLDFSLVNNYPRIDFSGYLDGNNKILKNITSIGAGVFDSLGYNSKRTTIKNLTIENIRVLPGSGGYLGGLTNSAMNTEINNVKIIGGQVTNQKGAYLQATGGLIGTGNNSVSIKDCYVEVNVSSPSDVGGLIGLNQNMVLSDIYFKGDVEGNTNKGVVIGCQYITDSTYNIPVNVFYETSLSDNILVGGTYLGHDTNVLPLTQLDKGIKKSIPITSITFESNDITMNVGDKRLVKVILNPANHTMKNIVSWKSSNDNILSVDGSGNILAKKAGKVKLTITAINNVTSSIDVTVLDKTNTTEQDVLKYLGLTKEDGFVYGFKVGTRISDIKDKINNYPNIKLKYFNNNINIVATGMTFGILIGNTEYHYTIIIKGDVDGDGKIFATDYVKIRNHIMGKSTLTQVALKAADVNNDSKVFATDYVKIRNYIMGKGYIDQNR